jgi:actin-related protein 8
MFFFNVSLEGVQVIPSPREIDPKVLVWKGGAITGRIDAHWSSQAEWEAYGWNFLKERNMFV